MVKKELVFHTYLYLILSMSLLFGAINIGSVLWDTTRVVFPHITISSGEWREIRKSPEKSREKKRQEIFASEKHDGLRSMLKSLMWLLILIPIFLVHLLLVMRNRRQK